MKRYRKVFWILAAVLGTVAILRGIQTLGDRLPMIEPSGPAAVRENLSTTPIRFTQQDFWVYPRRVAAIEGRLSVPALHDADSEATVSIRFVRFPAAATAHAGNPIVYLAGGPGGSGVETASGDRFPFFMALREAGDVIALDQRGTLYTEPYPVCPGTWQYPADRPLAADVRARAMAPFLEACWASWSARLHPDAFTTPESVQDLERLRIALGAERLDLVGISYGTHLALAYIRRFPHRVGRAVLAGVEGPDHTWKRPAAVDSIVRDIDRTLADEAGWKGFEADIRRAADRLAVASSSPMVPDRRTGESVRVTVGPRDLLAAVYYGLAEREDFLNVAKRVREIANGDDAQLGAFALRMRSPRAVAVMPLSMDCASGVSAERARRIAAEQDASLVGSVANLALEAECRSWPVTDLGDDYRSPVTSDVPVLAISGTLDLRTPPSQADEVLAGFSRSQHLRVVGGGHGDDLLIASPAIAEAVVRFLRTGTADRAEIVLPEL